ncbi:unnamed protein product, partial [Sphacelaria rigidula]
MPRVRRRKKQITTRFGVTVSFFFSSPIFQSAPREHRFSFRRTGPARRHLVVSSGVGTQLACSITLGRSHSCIKEVLRWEITTHSDDVKFGTPAANLPQSEQCCNRRCITR